MKKLIPCVLAVVVVATAACDRRSNFEVQYVALQKVYHEYGLGNKCDTFKEECFGSPVAMDMCVRAGFVAAGYLAKGNIPKYQLWKEQETFDCALVRHMNGETPPPQK